VKVLISADMEGATGVTWPADVRPGTEQWQRFRRMFTGDVNAAVDGFLAGGATAVLVNEAHATMRNLLIEALDERAELLTGRHKHLSMVEGIQHGDVDAVAFIGYHAGAGEDGVLSHTYLGNSITGVRVDGEPASEGRLCALVAAEFGVPVVLVTGDDRTCADAATYAPDAETVAVKDCVTRYAAVCRPPAVTARQIREAATRAARRDRPAVAASGGPHTVEVEFDSAHLPVAASLVPTVEQVGVRRVRFESPTMVEAIRCFKVVCTMVSAAVEEHYG
jgi:D-amino peptidase